MKVLSLDLIAYGPFTNATLDLSKGEQGLHIVYGPNEAGKSSALRAITDLFYGIHVRTPDNFVHPYPRLRIGAKLQHSDGSVIAFIRRKANQNALRQSDDATPLDDRELNRFLADVDRDLFRTMFGINHEDLRRGGNEIVQGGGQIGELLFSAGAGIADLHSIRGQLISEADDLFKSSGRSGSIKGKIAEFKEHQQKVKESLVSVETWKAHSDALQSAASEKQELDGKLITLRAEQNRLTRIKNAVPVVSRWKESTSELAELDGVPLLPEGFADSSQDVLIDLRRAEQQQEDAQKAIDKLNVTLEELPVPVDMLKESAAVEGIRASLGAYQKAMRDRPALVTECDTSETEARNILRRLGRANDLSVIEELQLPGHKTVRIQNLGNQQKGLLERLESDRRECDRIRREIGRVEAQLEALPTEVKSDSLQSTVEDIREKGDLEGELARVNGELAALENDANVELERLTLWTGTLEEAERLPTPSLSTIERFGDEFRDARNHVTNLEERLQDVVSAREEVDVQLKQLESEQAIPTESELQNTRRLRDEGWQHVLENWRAHVHPDNAAEDFVAKCPPFRTLPEAVQHNIEDADRIADSLRRDADRVATKVRLQSDREQHLTKETELKNQIEGAERALRSIQQEWESAWRSSLDISPLSPPEMREWFRNQQEVAELSRKVRLARAQSHRLEELVCDTRDKLYKALKHSDPSHDVETTVVRDLLRVASSRCDKIAETNTLVRNLRQTLDGFQRDLLDSETRFAEAEEQLKTWQSDWREEMSLLGLEEHAAPSEANSVLTDISALFQKYQEADQLRKRIEGIDTEAKDFENEVRVLVQRLSPDLEDRLVGEAVDQLALKVQHARSAQDKRDTLEQQRNEHVEKCEAAQRRVSEITASLDEMCRQAGCSQYDQLSEASRRSDRRRVLEASERDSHGQIMDQCAGAVFDVFLSEVGHEASALDSLQPRIDDLEEQIVRLGSQRDEVVRRIDREEAELRQVDGSAVAAEAASFAESVASELEDQIHRLAVLRMSSLLLGAGIEQHRKNSEGPVLGRASEIFRQLTLQAFEGLRADFNDQGEPILTGVRSNRDEAIGVGAMSDGTCDQLYLALRLASLESWFEHHEPLPFIIDDVFLNFDNDRAMAGLQVLAELSRRTQVVFFTHHDHLVDIAKAACQDEELTVTLLDEITNPT